MSESRPAGRTWRHAMMNQLGIILGFGELLLQRLDEHHPHREDLNEIRQATLSAMKLMAELEAASANRPDEV